MSVLDELEKEAPPFMTSAIFASIATPTVIITIEYADYIKARGFISMIDEWVDACEDSTHSKYINKLKKHSHLIPRQDHLDITFCTKTNHM